MHSCTGCKYAALPWFFPTGWCSRPQNRSHGKVQRRQVIVLRKTLQPDAWCGSTASINIIQFIPFGDICQCHERNSSVSSLLRMFSIDCVWRFIVIESIARNPHAKSLFLFLYFLRGGSSLRLLPVDLLSVYLTGSQVLHPF